MTGLDASPPCGWHCTGCSYYGQGCPGCRETGGKPFWTATSDIEACPVYLCCAEQEGLEHCGLCPQLPCETFAKWRDPSMSDEESEESLAERINALRNIAIRERYSMATTTSAEEFASQIHEQLQALPVRNAPNVNRVRRALSRSLRGEDDRIVLEVAGELRRRYGYRAVPYELILAHKGAFGLLGERELEELGRGLDSWGSVDCFARILSGPAWRDGLIGDEVILKWVRSPDRWWRRAALVSTVALNMRSYGGRGDAPRTLKICGLLMDDHDDMVEKALSWALRELVVHDARAVEDFISKYEDRLGSRVKREVRNKLRTGLKSPKRGQTREGKG
ncbi:MAG: DNA alkylation repair protein [Dehalococcoidia bacterium]|nr:DNA alkylation repair protein [Dehalococcoidia bacterium]